MEINKSREIGKELLKVDMGDMIWSMAKSIADAQVKLDSNSIEVAEMMGGLKTIYGENGEVTFEDSRIFFGKEKVLRSDAIQIQNETTDSALKTELRKQFSNDTSTYKKVAGTDDYEVKTGVTGDPFITIPARMSMLEIGFSPTFYQFVDNIIEVRIEISITESESTVTKTKTNGRSVDRSASLNWGNGKVSYSQNRSVTVTNVNATHAGKYSYSAEGSSLLRTKLTPIPPPPVLEARIRKMMEAEFSEPES